MNTIIKTLAIDDEPLALKQISAYIRRIPFLQLIAECQSALEAREIIENNQIDAIFIDIEMPDFNGIDFVRSLVNPPLVVFTTAYSEYAIEGYKVDAIDYLLKPFAFSDLSRTADKLKHQYELLNQKPDMLDKDNTIFLKSEYRVVRIVIDEISYVESMSEYLKIHFSTGARPLIVFLRMKKLQERLPNNFMRIHRSWIINLNKMAEINKNRILMEDGCNIPIGDNYRDEFKKYIISRAL